MYYIKHVQENKIFGTHTYTLRKNKKNLIGYIDESPIVIGFMHAVTEFTHDVIVQTKCNRVHARCDSSNKI